MLSFLFQQISRGQNGTIHAEESETLCEIIRKVSLLYTVVAYDPIDLLADAGIDLQIDDLQLLPEVHSDAIIIFAAYSTYEEETQKQVQQILDQLQAPALFVERSIHFNSTNYRSGISKWIQRAEKSIQLRYTICADTQHYALNTSSLI